jgi:hypothetical protein
METLKRLFKRASTEYNSGTQHSETCWALVLHCHRKLSEESTFGHYGSFNGRPRVAYSVFSLADSVSRPVRADIYIEDARALVREHDRVRQTLLRSRHEWSPEDYVAANRFVYTAVMSVACCFDLWQRSSRKTPGTFLEVFLAGVLQAAFPEATFSKHIPLSDFVGGDEAEQASVEQEEEEESSSVSTDLVIGIRGHPGGLVIPLKITTRERIVQPFAHQRILDAAYGQGYYRSLIVCMSETQLDERTRTVKQVCVPGTIKLFQKYLAPVTGLYYCDVPQRYAARDMENTIRVRSVGDFFGDIQALLAEIKSQETIA